MMTTSTISNNIIKERQSFSFITWRKEQVRKGNILEKPSNKLLTTWYAEQVVKGKIKASKKNKLAAKRHLNDLKRQGTDDFPWIFVEEQGHRPVRFIEKFCKPSKGDFNQLTAQPWQHFVIGSLYGWVHKDTGIRRFREGLIFVGRKNGKSTLVSGLTLYSFSKDRENGADVYLLANTRKQAGIIFDEAKAMVKKSPKLRRQFRATRDAIFYDKTISKIEPRASDSENLDGLNTHLGIFDEIHEFKDYKLINVIKKSRGSRKQPLILYITTAGYQLDGPLVNYYEQASDALDGAIDDERTFYFIAELDDEKEFEQPEEWIKANPNMGVSLDLDILKEDWDKDKRTPEERSDFITKQFNFFVKADSQSFLDYKTIKKNNKVIDIESLRGLPCIGGYDLSDSEDHSSACLEFPLDNGDVFVLSHSWIPERKVLENNEKIPYREWEEKGWLTIIPGEYVKKEHIEEWFVEQSKFYSIQNITYDPAKAFRLNKALESHGFVTIVVRQGALTLGPAVDDSKEMFIDGKVIFNNNKLFRWYINNVKLKPDRNKNNLPQKNGRYRKIDGFAAFLNAHTEVMKLMVEPAGEGNVEFVSVSDLMGG
ncbi:terminase large subunit [Virgibacillus pantothenticus]|uniref:Terminase n=1 Tax=Virgibacillus pantothenticus TaxID=1473 RepID=A0A0L0QMC9_VIRPA|nr:terminase large subunit [Virgibacillus pantothenticus]KNE19664.1 terminase [Virgibacillus pantothenticus]MED3736632.1 terminase large subunit [Virgibacillus pantothenticus]QTY14807.1 terminase large subunit [Virgibacillus pantothenticus]